MVQWSFISVNPAAPGCEIATNAFVSSTFEYTYARSIQNQIATHMIEPRTTRARTHQKENPRYQEVMKSIEDSGAQYATAVPKEVLVLLLHALASCRYFTAINALY